MMQNSGSGAKLLQLFVLTFFLMTLSSSVVSLFLAGNIGHVNSLKWAQGLQSVVVFVIPPLFLAWWWHQQPMVHLRLHRFPSLFILALVVLLMFASIPVVNLLGDLNQRFVLPSGLKGVEETFRNMEAETLHLTEQFLYAPNYRTLFFNLAIMAVIPAVGEELFFRGVFQPLLSKKWGTHAAIWFTAIVFSAFHFQFFTLLPRVLLGAIMGYLLVFTGSLWTPIFAHFVNNAVAVVFFFYKSRGSVGVDLEVLGKWDTWFLVFPCVAFIGFILALIRKKSIQLE